jgi:hypothetical protein
VIGYTFGSGSCTPTPIANCLNQTTITCFACKDRFYLSSNACLPVSSLCATYSSTNGDCLTCNTGYSLAAGVCSPIPIPNCQTQINTICSACLDRYYLASNVCLPVSSLCVTYDSTDGKCLTCGSQYNLAVGVCSPTPILNCQTQNEVTC